MALGIVLVGIATGLLAAGGVLVLGGGFGLAGLAYAGGGLAGMVGGVAGTLLPSHRDGQFASQDQL
jgi:hypothetical protein